MEGKIIEAKFKKNNILAYVVGGIGLLLLLIGIVSLYTTYADYYQHSRYPSYDSFFEFFFESFLWPTLLGFDVIGIWFFYAGILFMVAFGIIMLMMNLCALTITNARVIGKASFGKQVDLPINQISAVGLGWLNSITVATSAGRVRFWLIENRTEVHKALNQLLVNIQAESKSSATETNYKNDSVTDELKKYKELLDAGVITQEEFDAKKKQLLGL